MAEPGRANVAPVSRAGGAREIDARALASALFTEHLDLAALRRLAKSRPGSAALRDEARAETPEAAQSRARPLAPQAPAATPPVRTSFGWLTQTLAACAAATCALGFGVFTVGSGDAPITEPPAILAQFAQPDLPVASGLLVALPGEETSAPALTRLAMRAAPPAAEPPLPLSYRSTLPTEAREPGLPEAVGSGSIKAPGRRLADPILNTAPLRLVPPRGAETAHVPQRPRVQPAAFQTPSFRTSPGDTPTNVYSTRISLVAAGADMTGYHRSPAMLPLPSGDSLGLAATLDMRAPASTKPEGASLRPLPRPFGLATAGEPETSQALVASPAQRTRIVVHYAAASGSDAATEAAAIIRAAGFEGVELRAVAFNVSRGSTRFFHARDGETAGVIGTALTQGGQATTRQDFTHFQSLPSLGTIEVWIAG